MSKVSEEGYLFIHSSVFDSKQIELNLRTCINKLKSTNKNISSDIYVNVVENKDGMKYGHAYAWVSNRQVYNALIGKNFDGSERVEEIEDEDWNPPEQDMSEALKEAEGDWVMISEIEDRYERPTKTITLEPLIVPPGIKYTEEQKKILQTTDEFGFIEIFPARVTIRSEENKINAIYSSCIPNWVNEDILYKIFDRFNNDKAIHIAPKTKKKFKYPKIIISKNTNKNKYAWRNKEETSNVTIYFSPIQRNICHFLINVIKKIKVVNPNTQKSEMLFFSQAKLRT